MYEITNHRCERSGQYDVALRLLDDMRKKRMRFYDIGILDELFKRLLAGLSLLRGRGGPGGATGRRGAPTPGSSRGPTGPPPLPDSRPYGPDDADDEG